MKGFAFVEFNTTEEARFIKKGLDGQMLPPDHIFKIYLWSEFERILAADAPFKDYEVQPFKSRGDIRWYAADVNGRDQFLVEYGMHSRQLELYWNETHTEPTPLYRESDLSVWNVQWSPLGTYYATFHSQGVKVWAWESFEPLGAFPHPEARAVLFSPHEKYMITYSPDEMDKKEDPKSTVVWDLATRQPVGKCTPIRSLDSSTLTRNGR